jgi:hypothetical protein
MSVNDDCIIILYGVEFKFLDTRNHRPFVVENNVPSLMIAQTSFFRVSSHVKLLKSQNPIREGR